MSYILEKHKETDKCHMCNGKATHKQTIENTTKFCCRNCLFGNNERIGGMLNSKIIVTDMEANTHLRTYSHECGSRCLRKAVWKVEDYYPDFGIIMYFCNLHFN